MKVVTKYWNPETKCWENEKETGYLKKKKI